MKNMTIWNIARACKGHLAVPAGKHTGTCPAAGMAVIRGYSGKEAAGIVIDSRKVEPGDIFVAIRGERVDGHQFIREVFDKGAIAVVCEEEPEELPGSCIRVAFVPEGTASHSQEFVDAGKSESAHNCVIYGAKAIGGACYDLLTKEGLLDQVKAEFAENKKKNL